MNYEEEEFKKFGFILGSTIGSGNFSTIRFLYFFSFKKILLEIFEKTKKKGKN